MWLGALRKAVGPPKWFVVDDQGLGSSRPPGGKGSADPRGARARTRSRAHAGGTVTTTKGAETPSRSDSTSTPRPPWVTERTGSQEGRHRRVHRRDVSLEPPRRRRPGLRAAASIEKGASILSCAPARKRRIIASLRSGPSLRGGHALPSRKGRVPRRANANAPPPFGDRQASHWTARLADHGASAAAAWPADRR